MKAKRNQRTNSRALLPAALAIATVLAGTAWACTVSPTITARERSSAPGTVVTIDGNFTPYGKVFRGMPAPAGPVEVHWDTPDGVVVGAGEPGEPSTEDGTNVSIPVTIPSDASAGVFYLVAIQRDLDGSVIAKATETFEVTGRGAPGSVGPRAASAESLWSAFSASRGIDSASVEHTSGSERVPVALGLSLLVVGTLGVLASVSLLRRRAGAQRTPSL